MPHKILHRLFPTSIEFIANFDLKTCKQHKCNNIIEWVSFNLHKNPKKHLKKLLRLFKPLCGPNFDLKGHNVLWKYVYMNEKIIYK